MICSNEPGYYKPGAYGIRIENLVLVREAMIEGAEGDYLGFETLTHVPIARVMIEPALLTPAERGWIDAYHAQDARYPRAATRRRGARLGGRGLPAVERLSEECWCTREDSNLWPPPSEGGALSS